MAQFPNLVLGKNVLRGAQCLPLYTVENEDAAAAQGSVN
jgi:hypothetical protein